MCKFRAIAVAAIVMVSAVTSSHALFGAGIHWGYDLSLSMDDVTGERLEGFSLPPDVQSIVGDEAVLRVSRTNWKNSAFNLGGKVYIDFLPIFHVVELSANFGLWQYDGALEYLDPEASIQAGGAVYGTIPLTLDGTGLKYIGLGGTPYAKLHFDATIKRNLVKFPLGMGRVTAGAGLSAHFATPVLTGSFIEDVLGSETLGAIANSGSGLTADQSKQIVQKIIDETLGEPVFGAHIVAGVNLKLPLLPFGVYVDGKYMLPITKFDEDKHVSGFGLLLNMGLSFSI